jgi:16S rRNA (cytosine967-C5)-methyltransferase
LQLSDWQYGTVRSEKPREIAARILVRHAQGEGWAEHLLEAELARPGVMLSPADRGLAQELVFGVVRWQAALDWLIRRRTDNRQQKLTLLVLLRLGLYQVFFLDRIPDHAAVNESVELARQLGCGPQSGFINAILRGCLRERDTLKRELLDLRRTDPALGWSHPQWLCDRWRARWGEANLQLFLEWNNRPPPTFIRVNRLKATPEELAAAFEKESVLFTPRPLDWAGNDLVFELREHPSLATLESFRKGFFYVQDPSTLLAPMLLDPQPGETVLDLCAAPGGKTTFIAQLMQDRGRILAHDSDPKRLALVQENATRLGVTNIECLPAWNADALPPVDRVLVDAPCSNTGVVRRRVELRWRVTPEEIDRLRKLQLDLLNRAAAVVKPGGVIVYSTCSLEPEENSELIAGFLKARPEFRLEKERQLTPFQDKLDGAYVAKIARA